MRRNIFTGGNQMPLFSVFEILAETLVPSGILPPSAPNPFVIQGYWVQLSLAPGTTQANFNITFKETTDFNQGAGQSALQAQIVDPSGVVQPYKYFFASVGRGFLNQSLFSGQTVIYGVQALPGLPTDAALPQGGTGWRGTVSIDGQTPGSLIATPTQRLLYTSGSDITKATALDAVVYAVPTFSGAARI
ncbi:MAG: hypothetical protein K2X71_21470 [Methylobacterium sp.]|uniref:hypothetical protein n=1 Tax=Methylobacterium sp. TaxID=409 RepID=UPI00258CC729|nr:hypothetical protein [Methylobacterium sp.]MBY0298573.1 hypothetical protein [Methylobacterium sp.]